MKKIFLISILFYVMHFKATAQTGDEGVKLDLLKAPSSPASNLLGIGVSDIDKPTDVSAFMLSLQKSTTNFTSLPSNYAVDIAPYWLFKKNTQNVTTAGLENSIGKGVVEQTFVLSFAIRNTDSTENTLTPNSTYTGIGFKFSLIRGEYDDKTKESLNKIKTLQSLRVDKLQKIQLEIEQEGEIVSLRNRLKDTLTGKKSADVLQIMRSNEYQQIQLELNKRMMLLQNKKSDTEELNELSTQIKSVASVFQTARIGFTWDIAGGISAQFIKRRFSNSKVNNAGVWTTIGYTSAKVGSGLLLLRLLQNPDKIFAKDNGINDIGNITTFDFGGRYIYSTPQSKFNASLEGVYRSVLSSNTIHPSWRIVFNADYAILQNQKLTFSFGRNFDGTTTKDGNLIAALSFLTGFGNRR